MRVSSLDRLLDIVATSVAASQQMTLLLTEQLLTLQDAATAASP
ncbi:hypothetical protein [Nocardia sp. NPDC059239]